MRIFGKIDTALVDESVSEDKDGDAESVSRKVILGVVAHHNALTWVNAEIVKKLGEVTVTRLTVAAILVGGYVLKVIRTHTAKSYTCVSALGGKKRIGRKNNTHSTRSRGFKNLTRARVSGTGPLEYIAEVIAVKRENSLTQGVAKTAHRITEAMPKAHLIRTRAVIMLGCTDSGLESREHKIALLAEGGKLIEKHCEVESDKLVLVKVDKRAVKIK